MSTIQREHIKHNGRFEVEKFPYRSLRGFLGDMEERGELAHIAEEVSTEYELNAIVKKVSRSYIKGPGLYFHKPKDFPDWTFATNTLLTYDRYLRAMNTTREEVFEYYIERTKAVTHENLEDYYEVVERGDFEDLVFEGEEIDITKIPIPIWNEFDGGRYITSGIVMTCNPETNRQNMAILRLMVQSSNQTGILMVPVQDSAKNLRLHELKGENMPISVVIGADPLIYALSQVPAPSDISEFAYWGAITGERIQMVKCKTNNLLVPKTSEIVLEGEIPLGILQAEGPFGEFHGLYSGVRDSNIFKIKRVSMKRDAIYQGLPNHKEPCESFLIGHLGIDLETMRYARSYFPEIKGIRTVSAYGLTTVVAIDHKKDQAGLGKRAGHFLWTSSQIDKVAKNIIVVDDTVDIYSDYEILWALGSYVQGNKDISIVEGTPGVQIEPSESWSMGYIEPPGLNLGTTTRTVIDATPKKGIFGEGYKRGVANPPEEVKKKVEERWPTLGLDRYS